MQTPTHNGAALLFGGRPTEYRDAVVLGQGLPLEIDKQPVSYRWKESLHVGKFNDARGVAHEVTKDRIDTVIADFRRAFAKGYRPPIMLGHPSAGEAKDPTKSRGFIVGAQKNSDGNLELLHQFIGADAIRDAARNKTSICVLPDVEDETGEHYSQFIDHQALVPDPQLSNLKDFVPALAASRAASESAIVLTPAADTERSPEMDITKLREVIGAAKEITDEQVIATAVTELTSRATALTLSKTAGDKSANDLQAAVTRADTAEAKVLQLSKTPDPEILADRAANKVERIDLCLSKGKCSAAQANRLKEALKDGDKPAAMILSKSGAYGTPIDLMLEVLEMNTPLTGLSLSRVQQLPDPNNPVQTVTDERKKELLAHVGL